MRIINPPAPLRRWRRLERAHLKCRWQINLLYMCWLSTTWPSWTSRAVVSQGLKESLQKHDIKKSVSGDGAFRRRLKGSPGMFGVIYSEFSSHMGPGYGVGGDGHPCNLYRTHGFTQWASGDPCLLWDKATKAFLSLILCHLSNFRSAHGVSFSTFGNAYVWCRVCSCKCWSFTGNLGKPQHRGCSETKISGRSINNLRYADDATLMGENKEELNSFLMKVKEENEKLKPQHSEN